MVWYYDGEKSYSRFVCEKFFIFYILIKVNFDVIHLSTAISADDALPNYHIRASWPISLREKAKYAQKRILSYCSTRKYYKIYFVMKIYVTLSVMKKN